MDKIYIFRCRKCGQKFETDDVTDFFCKNCEGKKSKRPNEDILTDVREAEANGLTYGQYKGGIRRRGY